MSVISVAGRNRAPVPVGAKKLDGGLWLTDVFEIVQKVKK